MLVQAAPAASTWGEAGRSDTWVCEENAHLLRRVRRGAHALAAAIDRRPRPDGPALQQAVVEHLLLSASDWPFMIRKNTTRQYAEARALQHDERLRALLGVVARGAVDADLVAEIAREDSFLHALRPELPGLF